MTFNALSLLSFHNYFTVAITEVLVFLDNFFFGRLAWKCVEIDLFNSFMFFHK